MKKTRFTSIFLLTVALAVTVLLAVPETASATYMPKGFGQNYIEVYYFGYPSYNPTNASNILPTASSICTVGDGFNNARACVAMMQGVANFYNYGCGTTDGFWGPNTKAGLIRYQNNNYQINPAAGVRSDIRLSADGICGVKTWNSMGWKIGTNRIDFRSVQGLF